jgi:hypothetical protein
MLQEQQDQSRALLDYTYGSVALPRLTGRTGWWGYGEAECLHPEGARPSKPLAWRVPA